MLCQYVDFVNGSKYVQAFLKEYLNSDGQEFHQYRKIPRHMPFEVQVLD
jgi:hypothetical protein